MNIECIQMFGFGHKEVMLTPHGHDGPPSVECDATYPYSIRVSMPT